MTATVKQLFNRASMLNPSVSEISSMGQYVSQSSQMVVDSVRKEIYNALPEESLAYKILNGNNTFTEKQLWVIAFELQKNEEYATNLSDSLNEIKRNEATKKATKKARKANTLASLAPSNKIEKKEEPTTTTYGIGVRVDHGKFGEGVIVEEDQDRITVNFEEVGNKNLLKRFATLEII